MSTAQYDSPVILTGLVFPMNDCSESDDDTEDNHRQLFSPFPDLLTELTGLTNDDERDFLYHSGGIGLPQSTGCPA
jgi:hypothetical protein